jgi:hypothetical protein
MEIMKRSVSIWLLIFFAVNVITAQSKLTIIASVHNSTKYITQDTLLSVLRQFKADALLLELDSSLMDENGNFKISPQKISLEAATAQLYKEEYIKTNLSRIDVINRNQYYKTNETFVKENQLGKVIDSLYRNNMLNDTSWFIINSLYSASQILNNMGYMRLKDINSAICMQAASLRQNLLYKREVDLINNNSDLKQWYPFAKDAAEFWHLRNQTMIRNILTYIKEHPNKKIAVIVGYYHKYALMDGLRPLASKNRFVLVDDLIR